MQLPDASHTLSQAEAIVHNAMYGEGARLEAEHIVAKAAATDPGFTALRDAREVVDNHPDVVDPEQEARHPLEELEQIMDQAALQLTVEEAFMRQQERDIIMPPISPDLERYIHERAMAERAKPPMSDAEQATCLRESLFNAQFSLTRRHGGFFDQKSE